MTCQETVLLLPSPDSLPRSNLVGATNVTEVLGKWKEAYQLGKSSEIISSLNICAR